MSGTPTILDEKDYRAPRGMLAVALAAALVSAGLGFISFMAFWVEGARFGLYALPVWLLMLLYWLWKLSRWRCHVRLSDRALEVLLPAPRETIALADVHGVDLDRALTLRHGNGTRVVHGPAETLAEIAFGLRARGVPRVRRHEPPIIIAARSEPWVIMAVFGAVIFGVGLVMFWQLARPSDASTADRVAQAFVALLQLAIGGGMMYFLAARFVWRYCFTRETIELRHSFRTARHSAADVVALRLLDEVRTTRGIRRRVFSLRLDLRNGESLAIAPGAQNYPLDYAETHERYRMTVLRDALVELYQLR